MSIVKPMMTYFPITLVFSALISTIGRTVLTDATKQSVSLDRLPHGNATNVLPPQRTSQIDELGLFQTEMLAQSSNSKIEMDNLATDETGTEKVNMCQDSSDSFTFDIPIAPLMQDTHIKTPETYATKLGHDVLIGQAPLQEQIEATIHVSPNAASSFLAWCLDILVLAIILDGIRRWRYKNVSDPNKCCELDDWQKLMQAAVVGDLAQCEALLRNGVDVVRTDSWGCTVLHAAAKGGAKQIVSKLLECGSKVDDWDLWDEMPLHLAARAGHIDICELLIKHGAPVNVPNAQNWTPLVAAANEGREMTCQLLLNHGATAGGLADTELPRMLSGLLAKERKMHEEFPSLLWKLDEQDDLLSSMQEDDDFDAMKSPNHKNDAGR